VSRLFSTHINAEEEVGLAMFSMRHEAILGLVLVVLGLAILASNLEVFWIGSALLGLLLFGGLGIVFLAIYRQRDQNWWAAIPAGALFGLAGVTLLESIESVPGGLSGAVFLWGCAIPFIILFRKEPRFFWASIPGGFLAVLGLLALLSSTRLGGAFFTWLLFWGFGLAFAIVFLKQPSRWWSVIPSGVFFSLGWLALFQSARWAGGSAQAFIFFLGLAVTFGFLFLIRNEENRLQWAKYPAFVLLLISALFLFSALSWGAMVTIASVAMIGGGLYLIYTNRKENPRQGA
jgi:hypothetical protein